MLRYYHVIFPFYVNNYFYAIQCSIMNLYLTGDKSLCPDIEDLLKSFQSHDILEE